MNWRAYDEKAMQIAEKLRDKMPMLEWRVCDAATRAPHWRILGVPEFTDWAIRAQVKVNGHTCRAEMVIDAHLMDVVEFDMLGYVKNKMAYRFANELLAWRPKS